MRSEAEIRAALGSIQRGLSDRHAFLDIDEIGGYIGAEDALAWALGDSDLNPVVHRRRPETLTERRRLLKRLGEAQRLASAARIAVDRLPAGPITDALRTRLRAYDEAVLGRLAEPVPDARGRGARAGTGSRGEGARA